MFTFLPCNSANFSCSIFELFKNAVKINLLISCKHVPYKPVTTHHALWSMTWFDWLALPSLYRLTHVGHALLMKKSRAGTLPLALIKTT